jgi:proteic killer suppression protein
MFRESRITCCAMRNTLYLLMIQSFRHKGLLRFYESGSKAGIQPHHAKRLRMQLVALDTAQIIDDMNIAGFRLHPLKGEEKGRWSIWVNGNWRLTFEFRDGHAYVLDYEDYH